MLCLGLAMGAASVAEAQLTMQMSNGWSFTFAGNVNSFIYYTKSKEDGTTSTPGGLVPGPGRDQSPRITVGLLPAFAVFDAKGKEGETDLGVHFGFAPSVQCGIGVNDCFGTTIDMRQVFLTVGGTWGQLLVGRELGLFSRQNILTDQTLFGVGGSGAGTEPGGFNEAGGSTTLGRIGYGYVYPQFRAQITYSTPGGRPAQFSVGLFEAAAIGDFGNTRLPRVEGEFVYSASGVKAWLGGTLQSTKTAPVGTTNSLTQGGSPPVRSNVFGDRPGYYGRASAPRSGPRRGRCSCNGSDNARKSSGSSGRWLRPRPAAE
jgi:hypothetical protein